MKLITYFLLIIFFISMFAGQTFKKEHNININEQVNKMYWNSSIYEINSSSEITNSINKFIDCLGFTLFEFSKWSMKFGYENEEYNSLYILKVLTLIIIISLLISLIPIVFYLGAIIYIIYLWVKNKREKLKGDVK